MFFAGGYAQRIGAGVNRLTAALGADAGLTISEIHVAGNRYEPPAALYQALGIVPGDSMFSADPHAISDRLKTLPWIADVHVSRHYPDSVNIRIIEKAPFGLWRSGQNLYVVDRGGHPITTVNESRLPQLPLFFGEMPLGGADLVNVIARNRAVAARTKAMQRVTGRRWNLVLDDGVVVKLPEENWESEIGALERLIVEDGVLERDIGEIDLRSHDNYVFVLRHAVSHKNARGEPT